MILIPTNTSIVVEIFYLHQKKSLWAMDESRGGGGGGGSGWKILYGGL